MPQIVPLVHPIFAICDTRNDIDSRGRTGDISGRKTELANLLYLPRHALKDKGLLLSKDLVHSLHTLLLLVLVSRGTLQEREQGRESHDGFGLLVFIQLVGHITTMIGY